MNILNLENDWEELENDVDELATQIQVPKSKQSFLQCGNMIIYLPLRFYAKLIFVILYSLKICNFEVSAAGNLGLCEFLHFGRAETK